MNSQDCPPKTRTALSQGCSCRRLESCPNCYDEAKIIAANIETGAIKKTLTHLDLPHKLPDIAPVRIFSLKSIK
jgi:hypothetical protein